MPEAYRLEPLGHGCPTCQHGDEWDIIGPNDTAQSRTWGDYEEAEYICSLLNIAHQQGRVSYAEEVVERLKGDINAKNETNTAAVEAPKPFETSAPIDDIPF
jgi:hypothetical protein